MVGKTEDIHFYENQNLHLIISSTEDNLTARSDYNSYEVKTTSKSKCI